MSPHVQHVTCSRFDNARYYGVMSRMPEHRCSLPGPRWAAVFPRVVADPISAGVTSRIRHTKEPSLNTDLSVAPEIAQLAAPLVPAQHRRAHAAHRRPPRRRPGRPRRRPAALVGPGPLRPGGPVRIPVPGAPGAWLLCCRPARPPTATAGRPPRWPARRSRPRPGRHRAARPLRPGRVRVHGTPAPHRLRAAGHGYSVTLHAGSRVGPFGINSRSGPKIEP